MLCRRCSKEYTPTPEEERLIRKNDLTPLCPECTPAPRIHKVPPASIEVEKAPVLWRAERTDTDGKIVATMRIPKRVKRPNVTPLRKPRKDLLHVFVLSEGNPSRMLSSPRTILHTNLETFMKDKQNFWVQKIPSYWSGQTGIGRIEVKLGEIMDVIKEDSLTRVRCQDGSEVRLFYR